MPDDLPHKKPDVTIIGISAARLGLKEVKTRLDSAFFDDLKTNIAGLVSLNPLVLSEELQSSIRTSNKVYLIDSDYEQGGAVQSIAYQIHKKTGVLPTVLGLKTQSAGFADHCDNLTPDADRIIKFITETYFYKN
jgi:pyruvate/2-oxoglutarate/acetoin dehydrogenase E1 component